VTSEAAAVVREFVQQGANHPRFAEIIHPDVVWFGTRGGLDEAQVMRGQEAMRKYAQEIVEPWERFDVEIERLVETGDTVVVFLREIGQSRHGDVEVENETAMTFKLRDGRICEVRGYLDRDEALRAVGVAE
jgi:ketosteroid isomerase-like protein